MTMTNNPTIDGVLVPRELLELCWLTLVDNSSYAEEVRALLDAPAVERQPIKNASEVAYNLQAENARLEARIAELESGRGEPVMKLEAERLWEGAGEYAVSFVKAGWLDECRRTGGEFLLYAGPPAPVAVADKYDEVLLPFLAMMRNELHANAGKGDRPGWLSMTPGECLLEIYYHLGKLQKGVKDGNELWITEYSADVANMAMMLADICGCLDATAALNGVKP